MPAENRKKCAACGRGFWLFRREYQCIHCHSAICYMCLYRFHLRCECVVCHAVSYQASCCYEGHFEWLSPEPAEAGKWYCKECHQSHVAPLRPRYEEACKRCQEVELFPSTFHGRVPFDYSREKRDLETDWFRDRSDAERQLRTTARFTGFDLVYGVSQDRKTDSEGTYCYSVFSLRGVAAHQYHPVRK